MLGSHYSRNFCASMCFEMKNGAAREPSDAACRREASAAQRSHIDYETVTHITAQHTLVRLIDVLNRNGFDIGNHLVLRAEVQHLLRFGDAADAGPCQVTSRHQEIEHA